MVEITTDQVKKLRDMTGISIMQCRKALEETSGDLEKAIIVLQKKGAEVASKKADRNLGSGAVSAYIHGAGSVGAMVEILCETDFVSSNEDFRKLGYDIAMHIAALNPRYLSEAHITTEEREKAKEVFQKEVEGKPKEMQDKILTGKLDAYFNEMVLLNQTFIKNPEQTIKDLITGANQKFGERIEIGRFERFSIK